MGGLPVNRSPEYSAFPLYPHVQEANLVAVLFLSSELYLGMLIVQVSVKLLKLLTRPPARLGCCRGSKGATLPEEMSASTAIVQVE